MVGHRRRYSNRAFDMFLKTRYLLEQAGGRVVFATGTPISNTMAEPRVKGALSRVTSGRN
jgi:N12 class adenine-specific DNA methylase